jgi:flagellar secretion chaperone FliS
MAWADPYSTYRRIDVAGRTATADGPALVQLLYTELVAACRAAGFACAKRQYAVRSERVTRATAILFALETGLDFEAGGQVSATLQRLYAGARNEILKAALGDDPAPFHQVADEFAEIATAWATARAA